MIWLLLSLRQNFKKVVRFTTYLKGFSKHNCLFILTANKILFYALVEKGLVTDSLNLNYYIRLCTAIPRNACHSSSTGSRNSGFAVFKLIQS